MTDRERFDLRNAEASLAMEGLALNAEQREIVERIVDGRLTLEDYFQTLRANVREG